MAFICRGTCAQCGFVYDGQVGFDRLMAEGSESVTVLFRERKEVVLVPVSEQEFDNQRLEPGRVLRHPDDADVIGEVWASPWPCPQCGVAMGPRAMKGYMCAD